MATGCSYCRLRDYAIPSTEPAPADTHLRASCSNGNVDLNRVCVRNRASDLRNLPEGTYPVRMQDDGA